MQEIINAAGATAARTGIPVAVMVFGEGGQHAQAPFTQSEPLSAQPPMAADVAQQVEQDRQNVISLREQMSQVAQARDSALRQNEQLSTQLREAQARIAQMEAAPSAEGAPPPPPASADDQPRTILDHDALGIDTLNLPEKVVKACGKQDPEVKTIGELREFYPKLGDHKVNQKDRIATAEALMGYLKAPSGATAPPAAAPAAGTTEGVPAGFTDRAWPERLKIARFKENKDKTVSEKVNALYAAAKAAIPDLPDPTDREMRGEKFWRAALSALVGSTTPDVPNAALALASYVSERLVKEVTHAQIAAVLFCLGFDPKQPNQRKVDDALNACGLVHLAESVPEPADAAA